MAQVSKEGHEELSLGHTAFVEAVSEENESISGREQPVPRGDLGMLAHSESHKQIPLAGLGGAGAETAG